MGDGDLGAVDCSSARYRGSGIGSGPSPNRSRAELDRLARVLCGVRHSLDWAEECRVSPRSVVRPASDRAVTTVPGTRLLAEPAKYSGSPPPSIAPSGACGGHHGNGS